MTEYGWNLCHARIVRRSGGQAIVEMALVLVIFLSIVIGIIEFGRAFMVMNVLTTASRDGARAAAVQANLTTDDPAVVQRTKQVLSNAGLDPVTSGAIVEVKPPASRGGLVTVTVTLPNYQPISGAGGFIGLGTIQLKKTTSMRQEG